MKKDNFILLLLIMVLLFSVGYLSFNSGKNKYQNKESKTRIKESEKKVKTYKKEYDSLQVLFSDLEKQKQKIKKIYLQGKETIRYITKERISIYTDTLCKEDVLALKNHLNNANSLLSVQDTQLNNQSLQLTTSENILREKDRQIELYKNQKPKIKPIGIGIMAGYGTDFKNGLVPFVGVGISYNLIRL